MKLRIRSIESKQTLKIETPNPCSFQHFQELISQTLTPSPSPSSIHVSLNRIDELQPSSPQHTLQSLGITSGDLIFYTLTPNFSSKQTLDSSMDIDVVESHDGDLNLGSRTQESGEFDGDNGDLGLKKSFSVPRFLRKIFNEVDDGVFDDRKVLITAVHAVLLDSGFFSFDSASKNPVDSLNPLWYTLPDLLGSNVIEAVVLKFVSMGKFIIVYGSLANKASGCYQVRLNEEQFKPLINFVRKNCDFVEGVHDHEKEVFEFWRIVKDKLALPLLIDICERTGLPPPPSLMRLPSELKRKILDSLSGDDIGKMGIVCREFGYLISDNELWKKKFGEEFGDSELGVEVRNWKERFGIYWRRKKRNVEGDFCATRINRGRIRHPWRIGLDDRDFLSGIGIHHREPYARNLGLRNFILHPNFGERDY